MPVKIYFIFPTPKSNNQSFANAAGKAYIYVCVCIHTHTHTNTQSHYLQLLRLLTEQGHLAKRARV